MTTHSEDRELRRAGRYEWEQIVRRARLGGRVQGRTGRSGKHAGKATKGAVSGLTFKAVALAIASYANDRGGDIWPGDATVAIDLECGLETVKVVKAELVALGLLRRVRGRRGERGEEYQLTLPTDLLDVVEVLTPAQHKLAAQRLRETKRGTRGGSSGHPETSIAGGPVDTPSDPEPAVARESSGRPENGCGGSSGRASGGPVDAHTDHDRTIRTTDQSRADLRTAVTVSRATGPSEDHSSAAVAVDVWQALAERAYPDSPPDPVAADRARRGAALARRVLAGEVRPDELPVLPDDHQAVVLPFRRTRSA